MKSLHSRAYSNNDDKNQLREKEIKSEIEIVMFYFKWLPFFKLTFFKTGILNPYEITLHGSSITIYFYPTK